MLDEKYVVYKRSDMDVHDLEALEDILVKDAVVIRRQDLFAGPALHTYASNIALVAKMISTFNEEEGKELQTVADYFSEQAELADAEGYKIPD